MSKKIITPEQKMKLNREEFKFKAEQLRFEIENFLSENPVGMRGTVDLADQAYLYYRADIVRIEMKLREITIIE